MENNRMASEIGRGTVNGHLLNTNLEVDNLQIALSKYTKDVVKFIDENFTTQNAAFNNMSAVANLVNTEIAKSLIMMAYWLSEEDFNKTELAMEKADLKDVKVDFRLSELIKLVVELLDFEYPGGYDAKEHLINTFILMMVNDRTPYKFCLLIDQFRALRKFLRNCIKVPRKPAEQIEGYSKQQIDARSALLQEIAKFDTFYVLVANVDNNLIIDSKFKTYEFRFDSTVEEKQVDFIKGLIAKNGKLRFEAYKDKEDECIYLKNKKQSYKIIIDSCNKKLSK